MAFSFYPHVVTKDPVSGGGTVTQSNNYILLANATDKAYIQNGEIYHNDLETPCDRELVPGWVWDSARRLTAAARRSCGLTLPEDEIRTVAQVPVDLIETLRNLPESVRRQLLGVATPEAYQDASTIAVKAPKTSEQYVGKGSDLELILDDPEASEPKTWTCGECSKTVELRLKGLHIARHKRATKYGFEISDK